MIKSLIGISSFSLSPNALYISSTSSLLRGNFPTLVKIALNSRLLYRFSIFFEAQRLWIQKFMELIGWIPGFFGVMTSVSESPIWLVQIIELQKLFEMISNSFRFPGNWTHEIDFLSIVWAFGQVETLRQTSHADQKMRSKIQHMVFNEELTKIENYEG